MLLTPIPFIWNAKQIQPGCVEARPPTNDPSHMSISNEETHQLLQNTFRNLSSLVGSGNHLLNDGLKMFCNEVETLQLATAFHCFGKDYLTRNRITKSSATMKIARGGKIHVQPEAVKRRKYETGSRNAKKTLHDLLVKTTESKRAHELAQNIRDNVMAPKIAGRTMVSKKRNFSNVNGIKNKNPKCD